MLPFRVKEDQIGNSGITLRYWAGYGTLHSRGSSWSQRAFRLLAAFEILTSLVVCRPNGATALPKLASAQALKPRQCLLVNVCKHCISSPSKLSFGNAAEFHTIHPELAQEEHPIAANRISLFTRSSVIYEIHPDVNIA